MLHLAIWDILHPLCLPLPHEWERCLENLWCISEPALCKRRKKWISWLPSPSTFRYIISPEEVAMDQKMFLLSLNGSLPRPSKTSKVFWAFYQRFIRCFSFIGSPLQSLLKIGTKVSGKEHSWWGLREAQDSIDHHSHFEASWYLKGWHFYKFWPIIPKFGTVSCDQPKQNLFRGLLICRTVRLWGQVTKKKVRAPWQGHDIFTPNL